MHPIRHALVALALAALPAGALAQTSMPGGAQDENDLTVYAGYRFGGGFTDVTTGKTWELTDGPAYALAADFAIDGRTQWEIFVSHRSTTLKTRGFSQSPDSVGLGITYYHVGGTYFFDQGVGKGGYAVGGLGMTNFSPSLSGLASENRFSLNVGAGYMVPLAKYVALKLEGRAYVTLVDSSSGFFCSGGCVVQVKGTTFTQGEVMAGVSARF